jgi:hypothetical protein
VPESIHSTDSQGNTQSTEKKSSGTEINLPEILEPEVIRAKKMKLQGFKVVGKIELPEKSAKTPAGKDSVEETNKEPILRKEPKKSGKPTPPSKRKSIRKERTNRNLSYLEKQKKEERKHEREKQDRI